MLAYAILIIAVMQPIFGDLKTVCFDTSGPCQRLEKLECADGSTIHINGVRGWFRSNGCETTNCQLPTNTTCCSFHSDDIRLETLHRSSDNDVISQQCSSQTKCFPFDGLEERNRSENGLVYITVDYQCKASSSINIVVIVVVPIAVVVGVIVTIIIIYLIKRRDRTKAKRNAENGNASNKPFTNDSDGHSKVKDPSNLFSISSKGKSNLKGKHKDKSALQSDDFDEARYSKALLAYLNQSQRQTNANNTVSGSNLASTLSCLGIEVDDGYRPAGRTITRKQPSKQFAKRSQSTTSTSGKSRERNNKSMISTIAQNERFREENRKYRTMGSPMNSISDNKTELLDNDFDIVQFSNSLSLDMNRKHHKPQTKSGTSTTNHNSRDRASDLADSFNSIGVEVIEPKEEKRKSKRTRKRERYDGEFSSSIHRYKSTYANKRDTQSSKATKKQMETIDPEPEHHSAHLRTKHQSVTTEFTHEKHDQQHINNHVNSKNDSLGNKTRNGVTRQHSNPEKRNKYLWSESYEKLKSLTNAANLPIKGDYMDEQSEDDEQRHQESSNKYTWIDNINYNHVASQNKHLKALLATESKFKAKQSAFPDSTRGLESTPYDAHHSSAKENQPPMSDERFISDMDKEVTSKYEAGVQRSISMPSEYTLYYQQKMLQMDNQKCSSKKMESIQILNAMKTNDSNGVTEGSYKSERKRKRSRTKPQSELNKAPATKDKTLDGTSNIYQSETERGRMEYIKMQQNMKSNTTSSNDKVDTSLSKSSPRMEISIVDSGLSYKELSDEEDFVPSSNISLKIDTKEKADEAKDIPKAGTVENTRMNLNTSVQFGKYVNPKQVQTAVVRPMLHEKRLLSRSDSFTYSYSNPRSDEPGLTQTNANSVSNDNMLSRSADSGSGLLNCNSNEISITNDQSSNRQTSGRSKLKAAIRRKPSKEMPKFVNMSSLINANIMPATNEVNTIVQNTNKVPGDRLTHFHSERKQSFKFSNISSDASEGGHKSRAILFSRGMNEDITSNDLNEVTERKISDDAERESTSQTPHNSVPYAQPKPGNPHRSSSFLIQSTMEKTMAIQRSKSDRRQVAVRGSKL